MPKIALPLAACLLALAATGVHAQTPWKWRDASGQMHISDTAPPPGTPARNIISGPPGMVPAAPTLTAVVPGASAPEAAAPAAAKAASPAETALDKKKKAADADRAAKEKADRDALEAKNAAIRKDNCARAQSNLATIQSGVRMARTNANGEREFLDDAARAAETKRAQDAIAANCGAAPAQ